MADNHPKLGNSYIIIDDQICLLRSWVVWRMG